jgi:hypothetical protein
MKGKKRFSLVLLGLLPACVTERVDPAPASKLARSPTRPSILSFPNQPGVVVLSAGAYHGVTFFFELNTKDLPDATKWIDSEQMRQLPPLLPEYAGARETYRVRKVHRVDYVNSMFEVGASRYPRMPKARLYVFKKRKGNFSFTFRGQKIIVPADVPWIPSIYYYYQDVPDEQGGISLKEVISVGFASIETVPRTDYWLVNGKKYFPNKKKDLELQGAVHSVGAR